MSARNDQSAGLPSFEMTRVFQAPLARVWSAWSDPAQFGRWWGPQGCTVEVAHMDLRPGGFFHYKMTFEGAPPSWGRFNYRDVVASERIVWLNSFSNEHCGIERAPFSDQCPLEIENTVTLTEHAGTTTVTLRAEPFGVGADAEIAFFAELCATGSLQQGYGGTFDQLAAHLTRASS